ncbi:hypothetical protein NDU88_006070 [Pleurodeles waltl]|uniref:Uncharacterized protein n=1 Tax=Pleurodeles waltl TaxID=8319 RepID=A0AAV7PK17_PLEWA|nr:hypothetical protein NDU88_006070 [Pleurodeles waltl]
MGSGRARGCPFRPSWQADRGAALTRAGLDGWAAASGGAERPAEKAGGGRGPQRVPETAAVDCAMLRGCLGPDPHFGGAGAAPLAPGAVEAAAGVPVSDAPAG